jgi:uncharacterized DUF497 family protein
MPNKQDNKSKVVSIEGGLLDDNRTLGVRNGNLLDATTKRHYNYPVRYEWDERKRTANLKKHGLDFCDADLVFESELKATLASGKGGKEARFVDYAVVEGMLLALVYTLRSGGVRIISYRSAKRKERRVYYAAIKDR